MLYARSPYATGRSQPVAQPVAFDHRHHVADDAIDCRYCHQTVERSAWAGLPATEVCMGCHAQIWSRSPILAAVRAAHFEGTPIPWVRVHRLPEFVYFDHSIHVAKGVGCAVCHGEVERMAAVEQASPMTMGWCLDCHRDPARALGEEVVRARDLRPRTSCTTCHR